MAKEIKKNAIQTNNQNETVEVLYQKMGNRWFAFSLIDEEVFVGSITQEEIDQAAMTQSNAPDFDGNEIGNT
jgi:hypothetical protein